MSNSRRLRLLGMLAVFCLVAACSRVPPGGEVALEGGAGVALDDGQAQPGGPTLGDGGDTDFGGVAGTEDPAGDFGIPGGGSAGGAGGTSSGGAGGGGADGGGGGGQTGSAGGRGGGGGSPSARGASGPGIDGRTIKIVFHAHLEDCPQNDNEPTQDARDKGVRVINEYVKFFNQTVLKPYNWKFAHTIVDDGGYLCPERQRATALKIAREIKPFAALGGSASAQGPIIADVVTRAGIIHAGQNWQLQGQEAARHPYAWNTSTTADKSLKALVGWMQRRIKGTKVENRSSPTGGQVDRVYGILGTDDVQGRELVKVTRDAMAAGGMAPKGVYITSQDPGVASQQATTLVAKMREDGINTLVWAAIIQGSAYYIPITEAMSTQNHLPDIMTDYGNAFFAQLANKRVWANAKGASSWPAIAMRVELNPDATPNEEYNNINENSDGYIAVWQEKLGHNDSPQDGSYPGAYGTWTGLSLLATGIMHAGPVLTPETFARGLESAGAPGRPNRCTVGRFMGRDYKHNFTFEWDRAHDGGIEGFTTMYWVNRSRPPFTSGYYESYDNYTYFMSPGEIPRKPTHDTGQRGADISKQRKIGIRPWTPCSKFPNYPSK